jgi:hypothetical protein
MTRVIGGKALNPKPLLLDRGAASGRGAPRPGAPGAPRSRSAVPRRRTLYTAHDPLSCAYMARARSPRPGARERVRRRTAHALSCAGAGPFAPRPGKEGRGRAPFPRAIQGGSLLRWREHMLVH